MHAVQASCGCMRNKVRAIAEVDTMVPAIDTEPIRVNIGDGPSESGNICNPGNFCVQEGTADAQHVLSPQVGEADCSLPQTQKFAA